MRSPGFVFKAIAGAVLALSFSFPSAPQQSVSNGARPQREAMRKLSFLAGHWAGPVNIVREGEALHLHQTEDVGYRLGGLVLLIEGKSATADGKVLFSALATVGYDEASHSYRFRAYNGGHYLDTELLVQPNGFSWSFSAGPARIVNTMRLTEKGEWREITESRAGSNPPRRSVDMLLRRAPH